MKKSLYFFLTVLLLYGCNTPKKKDLLLAAGREAPLGWMGLEIYEDSSFDFTSRGLRETDHYRGHVRLSNDTLYFHYSDSIPKAGKVAVLNNTSVNYIAGKYPESLGIRINKFKVTTPVINHKQTEKPEAAIVKSVYELLQEHQSVENFEDDTEKGYLKIGKFLSNGSKNAIAISTEEDGWKFAVYNMVNEEWVEVYSQRDVGFSRMQSLEAYIEDYNFDGKKDIGIKNEVSNGTCIMTFRLWLSKGANAFQYIPDFENIGNPKIKPGQKIITGFTACCAFSEIEVTDYKWDKIKLRSTDSLQIDNHPYGIYAFKINANGKKKKVRITDKQIAAIIHEYGEVWKIK